MATLYVVETERPRNQWVNIANMPDIATQTVAIGGSSARTTNPFNAKTAIITISTDAICSIKIGGSSVTAATTDFRLPADNIISFSVQPNQYIAVISNT